jgi:hypothetical protein
LDPTGKITSVVRTHADGSLDYTCTSASDGTRTDIQYDAHGVKVTESVAHPNGSYELYAFNIQGQPYTTEHSSYDANGHMTLFERFHADGSTALRVTNSADGSSVTDQFNSAGAITSEIIQHADGTLSHTDTLASDGTRADAQYDGHGVEVASSIIHPDSSYDIYAFNIQGQPYSTIHSSYSANGQMTLFDRLHSDGSEQFRFAKLADGSSVTDQFNSAGAISSETVQHADGTLSHTDTLASDGTKTDAQYDAHGVEVAASIMHPDSSYDIYAFNIQGQPYSTTHSSYSANGQMTLFEQLHSDGSEQLRFAKLADGSSVTDQFNSTGANSSETVQRADGTLSHTDTLASDGTKTDAQYDAHGVEVAASIMHPDSSYDIYAFNIQGQPYSTTHSSYSANGQMTLFERLHSDGSEQFRFAKLADGSSVTDQFNSAGAITSETAQHADGTLSRTDTFASDGTRTDAQYDAHGVDMAESIAHPDGSYDIYAFNIQGQPYSTTHSSYSANGQMTLFERLHADGSEQFKVIKSADGSSVTDQFNSAGVITGETLQHADGSSSTSVFSAATAQHADGSSTSVLSSGSTGTTQQITYDASGNMLWSDLINTNGTNQIVFNHGNDQVSNFNAGSHDTITIAKSLAVDYSHLAIQQSGSDTLIHIDAADSILLKQVNASLIGNNNFHFV